MITEEQKKKLESMASLCLDEPMSGHTTFRTGGPAEVLVQPDREALAVMYPYALSQGIPVTVLGNGSNVLVPDSGVEGLVIVLGDPIGGICIDGTGVSVEAGARLAVLAKEAAEAGLSGLEFAGGIPGTMGGAVMMNAGAYGGQMADVLVSVTALNAEGEFVEYKASELALSYRHSLFMEEGHRDEIVVSAELALIPGERSQIRAKMADFNQRRREKQPLEYPSAGSTFKRPEGYFAGKLIQDAGLAGYRIGGAMVSDKHCGFVVNVGDATSADILALIDHVKATVKEQSGVTLEEEVRIL